MEIPFLDETLNDDWCSLLVQRPSVHNGLRMTITTENDK